MVDLIVALDTGEVREYKKVRIRIPQGIRGISGGPQWIDFFTPGEGGQFVAGLNFRAYSLNEVVSEKIKIRKRDGVVLDSGQRVTGIFDSVTIRREGR